VAAIFLSGPTIFSGFVKGFGWNHLDGFHFFPGLPLASSRFSRYLDSKLFFGFGSRFFYSGLSDTGSQGFRWIYGSIGWFSRDVGQMFFRTLDFNWIVKVWILRFSGSLDLRGSKDFRILGFSKSWIWFRLI